jgi:hypothetical protein|tara:strand:- start:3355 stop:3528 length:174 start_codon:yes stop_codon:yes gene_type:complete
LESKNKTQADMYDEIFFEKWGWASCFECDIIFEDLEKLAEHQDKHLIEEQCLNMKQK